MALVFEASNGASLDSVRVPSFFTYNGFYHRPAGSHADHRRRASPKTNGCWAPRASKDAVQSQFERLFPDILDIYSGEFIAAWDAAIKQSHASSVALGPQASF